MSKEVDNRGVQMVAVVKPTAAKKTFYSINWCDKTTWWVKSDWHNNQSATPIVVGSTYQLPHTNIIDMCHGKITQEDFIVHPVTGQAMCATVYVNGVPMTENDPDTGLGDYSLNYKTGVVTFSPPINVLHPVTADYAAATTGDFLIQPSEGKVLSLDMVEVQFTDNIVLKDTIRFQPRGLVDVFSPESMPGIPSGTKIPIADPVVYKTIADYMNDATRAYPKYPALSASNWRGVANGVVVFDWDYVRATPLFSSMGMDILITMDNNEEFGGEYATASFYCSETDE